MFESYDVTITKKLDLNAAAALSRWVDSLIWHLTFKGDSYYRPVFPDQPFVG